MAEKILITTPEHVELEFTVAGIGSRFLAAALDLMIQISVLIGVYVLFLAIGLGQAVNRSIAELRFVDSVVMAVLTFVAFAVFWGYFIFFETRWNGQTPGKRKVGLRVIRDSGHPIDFRASLIRSVVRVVDWLPAGYALGFAVMFFNPHWKRLGDFAAGTLVIQEKKYTTETGRALKTAAKKPLDASAFELLDDTALGKVSTLTRKEYQTVRHFLNRRSQLGLDTQLRLGRNISYVLSKKLNTPHVKEPGKFLEEVERAYRHLHGE